MPSSTSITHTHQPFVPVGLLACPLCGSQMEIKRVEKEFLFCCSCAIYVGDARTYPAKAPRLRVFRREEVLTVMAAKGASLIEIVAWLTMASAVVSFLVWGYTSRVF